ncbi:MAG: DnaD domain protein [Peptococcaceae bacterium]|nr:DnaD domain protein [Peptococcaceae bacterium]
MKELAKRMGIPEKEIENSLARLLECEFLAIEKHWDSLNNRWFSAYNLIGLINELAEHWAIESFKRFEIELVQKKNGDKEAEKDALSPSHPQLSSLIKTYEKELGRPLTGMECEFIGRWLTADFSQELIVEALRRGVGAGIRNFRYLDSILREWEKKNLRTLTEIEAEDAFFQERHEKKTRSASKKKTVSSKYDNFDL